jgi:SAM-dependent methyltransferase
MYNQLAAVYDRFMLEDVDYPAYAAWISQMMNARRTNIEDILEVGCGTGSMTLALHKLGFQLTGMDLSEEMLVEADSKAFESGATIRWVHGDIIDMVLQPRFDAVISTMDTFNYILEEAELLQAMTNIHQALKPGGVFIFDVNTPYRLASVYADNSFHYVGDDVCYIWECSYDSEDNISRYDISFFVQTEETDQYTRFDEVHLQKAYEPVLLKRMLEQTGFEQVEIFDYLSQDLPGVTSEKVCMVAVKKV